MTDAESIAADLRADGQEMTLTRTTPGAYDEVLGAFADTTVQEWPVWGITANFNRINVGSSFANTGTVIMAGDKKIIISAEVEPLFGDSITTVTGVVWQCMAIIALDPLGEALLYTVQGRK